MPKEGEEEVLELEEEDILEEKLEGEEEAEEEEAEEGFTVQIGDEEPEKEEEAPEWVKDLRKANRDDKKRIKELEEALKERDAPAKKLGDKPTLEGCDFDAELFEKELDAWKEKKRQIESSEEEAKDKQRKADERWQAKLAAMNEKKSEIKAPDYEDAEEMVKEMFSVVQQGIAVQGAENPALLVYALGKNPKKAKELAAIQDPIEFAFALAKTEAQLKVGSKSSAPPPEKGVTGRAGTGAAVDNTLDKLRAEAAKTGDMSKVMAYKRKQKEKA